MKKTWWGMSRNSKIIISPKKPELKKIIINSCTSDLWNSFPNLSLTLLVYVLTGTFSILNYIYWLRNSSLCFFFLESIKKCHQRARWSCWALAPPRRRIRKSTLTIQVCRLSVLCNKFYPKGKIKRADNLESRSRHSHRDCCMLRCFVSLIRYFSNYLTLHRSYITTWAAPQIQLHQLL